MVGIGLWPPVEFCVDQIVQMCQISNSLAQIRKRLIPPHCLGNENAPLAGGAWRRC